MHPNVQMPLLLFRSKPA